MGMTFAQKILSRTSGRTEVQPGESIHAQVDGCLANDVTAPIMIDTLRGLGGPAEGMVERFRVYFDHYVPAPSQVAAENHKKIRHFCAEVGMSYSEGGLGGHLQLPVENGHCRPGMLFIGADSHTTLLGGVGAFATGVGSSELAAVLATGELWFRVPEAYRLELRGKMPEMTMAKDVMLKVFADLGLSGGRYKALEFSGEAASKMSLDSRLCMASMAVDIGAKIGVFPADDMVVEMVKAMTDEPFEPVQPDADAHYAGTFVWDVSEIEPLVACPPRIDNVLPVHQVRDVAVDEVYLGSCTNGRLEDLRGAAKILHGRTVHPRVRMIVAPQSRKILLEALKEGTLGILLDAGAVLVPPGCGPCSGTYLGVMASDEVVVSTGARNSTGRMGSGKSLIYVVSPLTAAASAITGHITDPREVGWEEVIA